jgi:hypothetical protein
MIKKQTFGILLVVMAGLNKNQYITRCDAKERQLQRTSQVR